MKIYPGKFSQGKMGLKCHFIQGNLRFTGIKLPGVAMAIDTEIVILFSKITYTAVACYGMQGISF